MNFNLEVGKTYVDAHGVNQRVIRKSVSGNFITENDMGDLSEFNSDGTSSNPFIRNILLDEMYSDDGCNNIHEWWFIVYEENGEIKTTVKESSTYIDQDRMIFYMNPMDTNDKHKKALLIEHIEYEEK